MNLSLANLSETVHMHHLRRSVLVILLALGFTTSGFADIDCSESRVYSKDLTQAKLEFLMAFVPAVNQRPDKITVRDTEDGPIYQLVTTCDGGFDWVFGTQMTSGEYQSFYDKNSKDGYRPHLVEVYGEYPDEQYLSVMINDGLVARARHRVEPEDWSEVREELENLEEGTLDPFWFSSTGIGTNVRYACIWTARTDANTQKNTLTGLDPSAFSNTHEGLRTDGSRLISASVHGSALFPQIGGFFTRGIQPEWSVHQELLSPALEKLVTEKEAAGWEVDFVTGYSNIVPRYLAVFKRDPQRTFRVTGTDNPGFDSMDDAMEAHMQAGLISRGALAITDSQGRLVLARGYTWDGSDVADTSPTDLFRFASVSKPITAVATMALLEDHPDLELDGLVSDVLDDWEWCGSACGACLFNPCSDPNWPNVRWHHLLQHYAGFPGSEDPMGADRDVRDLLNAITDGVVTLPVSLDNIHEYQRLNGIDSAPDDEFSYSNYGYSLLGRLIERASGQSYEEYVQNRVFAPLCVDRMRIGVSSGAADEVRYEDSRHRLRETVMEEEDGKDIELVPRPYGGFNVANYDAHGGWVGTVVDVAAMMAALHDPADSTILEEDSIVDMFSSYHGQPDRMNVTSQDGHGWNMRSNYVFHNGNMSGTHACIQRWNNGASLVVVFNRRNRDAYLPEVDTGSVSLDRIRERLTAQWSSIIWPTEDHWQTYLCPESMPADLNGDGAVDAADLGLLISAWGDESGYADLNGDGIVGSADLGLLISDWSP